MPFTHLGSSQLHLVSFLTVLEVFWAKEMYTFTESDGNALTMLQTNSSYNDTIELIGSPNTITENVTVVRFQSMTLVSGTIRVADSEIRFVNHKGKQYGVGTVGE